MDFGICKKMALNCGTEAAATSKAATSTTMVKVRGDSFATQQFIIGILPITKGKPRRNEHPMMVHTITQLVNNNAKGNTRIIVLTDGFPVGPLASGRYCIVLVSHDSSFVLFSCSTQLISSHLILYHNHNLIYLAIAKAFPLFSMKTKKTTTKLEGEKKKPKNVDVIFLNNDFSIVNNDGMANGKNLLPLTVAAQVATGVRLAARLVDAHPEFMTTTRFAHEVQSLVAQHNNKNADTDTPGVTFKQIVGEELNAQHYGGLYGVGT